MRIIPAIDIIDGKCVRLTKGDYSTKKIYSENPLELAKEMEDKGINYLHIVDLDGAKSNNIMNYKTLETIASKTNLHIDFGGGIKSLQSIKDVLNAGAKQVTLGSIAVNEPNLVLEWLNIYGPETLILGADCRDELIATNGWQNTSNCQLIPFMLEYETKGMRTTIVTDIAKDGMLKGPSFELYDSIIKQTDFNLIASGGIQSIDDLIRLKEIGCEGTIVGKALYEGYISIAQLAELC